MRARQEHQQPTGDAEMESVVCFDGCNIEKGANFTFLFERGTFLTDNPHSLLWEDHCLRCNLDSLFATPDNRRGTFLQWLPLAGVAQTL